MASLSHSRPFLLNSGRHPRVWGNTCVLSLFLPSCTACTSSRLRGTARGQFGRSPWRIVPAHRRRGLPPPQPPPPPPPQPPPSPPPPPPVSLAATCRGIPAPHLRADLPPSPHGEGPPSLPYGGRGARGGVNRRGGSGHTHRRRRTDARGARGAVAAAGATRRGTAWPSRDPPAAGGVDSPGHAGEVRVPNRDSSLPRPPCARRRVVQPASRSVGRNIETKAGKRAAMPPAPHCHGDGTLCAPL